MSANMRNQNMNSWNQYETVSNAMSESEFPSLSELSTDKQRKTSNKRNVIKLVVPLKTYKDELRDKYSDARPASENLKTRMCNSVEKNEICLHGERCRFAHSLEELVTRDCHFKDKCRFVKNKSGKLVNDGDNICRNKHPQESQDDFLRRIGLSHYKIDDDFKPKADFACDRETNYKCATEIKSSIKIPLKVAIPHALEPSFSTPRTNDLPVPFKFSGTLPPSLDKEIVLRVPKVLAIQALELAINSGNRCIRVEVIE